MAITKAENVVAARVFYNGLGVEFHEKFTKQDGTEGVTKLTAWFKEDPGISEGQVGNVSGLTGVKARLWERDGEPPVPMADIVLNSARFEAVESEDTPF